MPHKDSTTPRSEERLSQLIRLKQSEKPDQAFWAKFDEELHNKQLAAIVRRQTWYHLLSQRLLSLSRKTALPSGIIAVMAFATYSTLSVTYFAETPPSSPPSTQSSNLVAETISEEPLFEVVPQPEVESFVFEGPATYGVNVLAKQTTTKRYVLEANPKTFTSNSLNRSSDTSAPQLGAKVIHSGHQF